MDSYPSTLFRSISHVIVFICIAIYVLKCDRLERWSVRAHTMSERIHLTREWESYEMCLVVCTGARVVESTAGNMARWTQFFRSFWKKNEKIEEWMCCKCAKCCHEWYILGSYHFFRHQFVSSIVFCRRQSHIRKLVIAVADSKSPWLGVCKFEVKEQERSMSDADLIGISIPPQNQLEKLMAAKCVFRMINWINEATVLWVAPSSHGGFRRSLDNGS